MEITKAGIAFVAAACISAGAAGGYLLTRHEPTVAADSAPGSVGPDPGALPVEQSEAVVDEPAPSTPTPVVAPTRVAAAPSPAPRPTPLRQPASPHQPVPARPPAPAALPPAVDTHVIPVDAPPVLPVEARPAEIEAARPIEPLRPQLEDLVLAGDSVIGLQVETAVSSETARVEDRVVAVVVRDVKVGNQVAIPAGSKAHGEVTLVERGGRLKDRARLGIRFTSVVLADGTRIPLETETIYREGSAPSNESAAKIGGGAIAGAIIGGILGGAKGAIIGGSSGAGAGTAAVMAGGRNPATLPSGTPITVRVAKPATVTVEK